ncbi:MAG: exodeoxyribonuclease V subunit gamma [Proteobacteria bacterium]|nr:exodeoxyribonuclease V subunit gamma [Pseudomonadota bacterium]MCP4921452.1 exodeoxyribonuclease V subunit gamma [Pseudomonadota bacterium]
MYVYKSNRVEELLKPLLALLRTPTGHPFEQDVVVVHSKGMEKWLAMQIGQSLGICANLRFPFPGRIVQEAFEAALGDRAKGLDAWRGDALTWALIPILGRVHEHDEFAALAGYLEDDPRGLKRYQLALRIGRTFDRYVLYRPDRVLEWERGGGSVDETWQPALWRQLAAVVEGDHLARLRRPFVDVMTGRTTKLPGFPSRLILMGVSSLPELYVDVLSRLARHIDVHLFQLTPSDEWWADTRSRRQLARQEQGLFPTTLQEQHLETAHPLLNSLGRLAQDFQNILEDKQYHEPIEGLFRAPIKDDLLGGLQADMRLLRHDTDALRPIDAGDESIQVHSCHGQLRQVQVLQDQLLQTFRDMPMLQPRDVCVMMPNVEEWAPLVRAVFDRDPSDSRFIPFRVADRSLRRDNAVAEGLLAVLALVDGRVSASQVLDLLGHAPLRDHVHIGAEDVDAITDWVRNAGIRWGIDADHRARFGVPANPANTWRFGLDRLLLGRAMRGHDDTLFMGTLPYDEVEGTETRLLGRFVDLCEALFATLEDLREARDLVGWKDALERALVRLFADDDEYAWQHQQVRGVVADFAEHVSDETFELDVVRAHLGGFFEESMPARGFLSGQVTFCAMVPMRSIPFRVVCLLGMDEQAYPRRATGLRFDLVQHGKPRAGDRTPREDDRTLFLEALLSARDRVIITYRGQDIRDNKPLPPSVMVTELLDVLCEARALPDGDLRKHMVVQHPLQPFSPANFGEGHDRLFSYDHGYLEGARALRSDRVDPDPFLPAALEPLDRSRPVRLDELCAFFEKGATVALLHNRLRVRLRDDEDTIEDREPVEVGGLGLWQLGDPLLRRAVANDDFAWADQLEAVRASGSLPHGVPGQCLYEGTLIPQVQPIADQVRSLQGGTPLEPVQVDLDVGGTRLIGSVSGWTSKGRLTFQFSRIRGKHQVRAYIEHLASMSAGGGRLVTRTGIPVGTALVGRSKGGPVGYVKFKPLPPEHAMKGLADLLELYFLGHEVPLALFPDTSLAFSEASGGWKRKRAAENTWRKSRHDGSSYGEGTDAHIERVFGPRAWEQDMTAPGFADTPDFEELADRVFGNLLYYRELR